MKRNRVEFDRETNRLDRIANKPLRKSRNLEI